ncbi:HSP13 protein, partial [Polyodon spathula]|nr:HSP13 protein [Polyodon spathula]
EGDCEAEACDQNHNKPSSNTSISKKMRAISLTMRKKMGKKYSKALSEEMCEDTERDCRTHEGDHELGQHSDEAPLKACDSMESLYSGRSSSSGVTSGSDRSSNRDSIRLEEDVPYPGPFCGSCRVHTDFIPSPYDSDSLKLKKGDVIEIISKPPMGTWTGMLHNKVGSFKFIYVDVIHQEEEVEQERKIRPHRRSRRPRPKTLLELLERLDLKEYASSLLLNGYQTVEDLKELKEKHLIELNVPLEQVTQGQPSSPVLGRAALLTLRSFILLVIIALKQYLPPPKPKVIGIDLGTTFCSVGVFHPGLGEVEVIGDLQGRKSIPSVVSFTVSGIHSGYEGQDLADANPLNTIYDAKRFIGKLFTPEDLERESAPYQFQVLHHNGSAEFSISTNRTFTVTPEYIGSRLLLNMKKMAEGHLGVPISKAVISVPADFDERQRNYTVQAANLAGLEVLRVINEPTAAAMAYGLHKVDVLNVLVVDLGGGTLDVSLLNKQGGMFLTRAMAGNNKLGGQDFNQRLLQHVFTRVHEQYGALPSHEGDIHTLRQAVEAAKLNLTLGQTSLIRVPLSLRGSAGSVVYEDVLTRQLFEDLNADLFQKILTPIEEVLREGRLDKSEVDEIVLVGGSTRIPRIRQIIAQYFGMEPNTSVDPELAVVIGVALQAGIMGGSWPLQVSAIEIPNRHLRKSNFL